MSPIAWLALGVCAVGAAGWVAACLTLAGRGVDKMYVRAVVTVWTWPERFLAYKSCHGVHHVGTPGIVPANYLLPSQGWAS